ncbi:MAG: capsular polysaccharide biosynthesis protein [Saprospiraceae bacterium]|nr:MAG: capsular polysaccharide biosynthesis protein [Saprospiraceae bacterium]
MHSHLIPGIDDGAPDVETSVTLIKGLMALGFKRIITTPHIMADLYPNTPEIIQAGLEKVRTALKAEKIDIPIDAAAEYLMDEAFGEKIDSGQLLTLPGNYVLVEMSFISPPPQLNEYLFLLQTKGYKPIMAHPERYMYLGGDLGAYERLKERGCLMQLNLLSLTGYYGREIQRSAFKMTKAGLFDLAGTDLHHEGHREALEGLLKGGKANVLLGGQVWRNVEVFG